MARSVDRGLVRAGLAAEARRPVAAAFDLAVARRMQRLSDPRDPRLLHPGRTLIVLLADVRLRDPRMLAAAALLESVDLELGVPPAEAARSLGPDAGEALRRLPVLAGGLLGEADTPVEEAWEREVRRLEAPQLAVVLAEALDHLRHLHQHPPSPPRRRGAQRAGERLVPLAALCAERIEGGEVLQRRLSWWWRRVGKGLAHASRGAPSERPEDG